MRALVVLVLVLASATCGVAGCSTTRPHERGRLSDHCMGFAPDATVEYLRAKAEGAREGGFGGYGRSAAGGCGCE
ncbi:MAG: hypothetical protein CVU56_11635 [Deltaproteobacteria bacterium HGW-Deltaproteobacteria-14]|nr:MAG: hypothetical protein CVU56_11635 [Deltaproteobacteria bacterium HGW-Deltaproteobacteria-14]